jgi:Zn-dependent protease/CBS domain-containing protein
MSTDDIRGSERGAGLLMGRLFGVPIYVAPTWFLIAALITVLFAPSIDSRLGLGAGSYFVALAFAVLLYGSVLVHELSHSVVALGFGLPVRRITLYLLGGVSEIEREPETPGREFAVAVAGPILSLVLAAFGYALVRMLDPDTVLGFLALELTFANFLVGIFNLLPGLPLDGGRVLQAAVWKATGRRTTGLLAAGWVGRAVAVLVVALPLLVSLAGGGQIGLFSVLWGALIATFIWAGATQAIQTAKVRERLPNLRARTLTRRALPVSADLPLAEALRRANAEGARALVIVDGGGSPTAIVNEAAVTATPEQRRPWVSVGGLARSLESGLVIDAGLEGEALVRAMQAVPATEYLVVEPTGEVYGVLAAADVDAAFAGA